jgi:DNA-3-methyladenine glycosylase I
MTPAGTGLVTDEGGATRCWWGASASDYVSYHDDEWGRPLGDDTALFELISLEGFQSGLSWLTILRKRDNFRRAFKGFEPASVARFNSRSIERLMIDCGIVRNRAKIVGVVNNARRSLALIEAFGSLAAFLWRFEPPPESRPARIDRDVLLSLVYSDASIALSKDLKRRGWAFVGPTTIYSFMQSAGLVNDHLEGCDWRETVEEGRRSFVRPA